MEPPEADDDLPRHRLSWTNFDALARGRGGAIVVRQLRRAERSRRLLLLRALIDDVVKNPELPAPLPSPEDAWELLARTERADHSVIDLLLAHPYTGFWLGYTTRLSHNRITGVGPLWAHIGYLHTLAAAAAARAGINFTITTPAWHGDVVLPTLGLARLDTGATWSTAEVTGSAGRLQIRSGSARLRLPADLAAETPGWWPVRLISSAANGYSLSVRLDDVDPFRGPYEPLPPQRTTAPEARTWHDLVAAAWRLVTTAVPAIADAMQSGFESIAPRPAVPFRAPSASSAEAFGSAIIGRPEDAATLAAMLVHEFQHSQLGGLLHLTQLTEDDQRARLYVPWRDDPRPIGGVVQGTYAFFGMAAFWRSLAESDPRAAFEFAYHRAMAWRISTMLVRDGALTDTGRRFLDGIVETLRPWQHEPVPRQATDRAAAVLLEHYLCWRMRHLRPDRQLVTELTEAWLTGDRSLRRDAGPDPIPTPVPDGPWSQARLDLVRLDLISGRAALNRSWPEVPGATSADLAWVTGRSADALRGYRAELAHDPDRPVSWSGLALALSALGPSPSVRALRDRPELVRAVHRRLRDSGASATPEEVADWIGRIVR